MIYIVSRMPNSILNYTEKSKLIPNLIMINKKLSLLLLAIISMFAFGLSEQISAETVNVLEPGTLRELVNELPSPRLKNLIINGSLNGKDIAYLVGGSGKMVSVDTLDISKVTLEGDNEPYKELIVEYSNVAGGYTTEVYYLSEQDSIIYEGHMTGLGGLVKKYHVYCNDLSGAFAENSSFKKIIMPENLTKIGNYQFFKNTSVCSVELPKKATTFGQRAFDGASALTSLCIPEGTVTIPSQSVRCESLETVELPSSVDSIYNEAFQGAPIKNIDLSNVRYIGASAFSGNKLSGILDIKSLNFMGKRAFYGPNEIKTILFSPDLKDIPDNAFKNAGLTSLELPSNIESIGVAAFSGCENLTTVVLSPNIVNIANNSFEGTPWLKNLKGDNGVIYAGTIALSYDRSTAPKGNAFSFRNGTTLISNADGKFFPTLDKDWHLEKVTLPESLIRIGNNVFNDCRELKEINIPDGLLEIGISAFERCESLESIDLPEGITEIPYRTFYGCKGLQEITFPHNINRIGESAFENATNMYFSELPSSLKVIESRAFLDCKSIPSVILPEYLDSISDFAFLGCTGIETIKIKSKNLRYAAQIFGDNQYTDYNLYQVIVSPEVTTLPKSMFSRCDKLEKLKFEDINSSVLKKIDSRCFSSCKQLSISELPASLDSIGGNAFYQTIGCIGKMDTQNFSYIGEEAFARTNGITELIISNPIYIGAGAFVGCPELRTVTILSESIDCDRPFYGGSSGMRNQIQKVEIGTRLEKLPERIFEGCKYLDSLVFQNRDASDKAASLEIGAYAFADCSISGCLSLPNGTIKVGKGAFLSNLLSEIILPNTCKEIAPSAFAGNYSLSDVSICDGIEIIGEYAFSGANIRTMTIPASCKEIGTYFIRGCSALESLYFLSDTPPTFEGELIEERYYPTIYVPYNSLEIYREVPQLMRFSIEAIPFSQIPVESILLTPNEWIGEEGESFCITATVLPENASDKTISWSSSDEAIATVNTEGIVSVLKEGSCVITATAEDGSGVYSECIITSTMGVDGIFSDTDNIDVFGMSGIMIKKDCDREELKTLCQGIYIIRYGNKMRKFIIR